MPARVIRVLLVAVLAFVAPTNEPAKAETAAERGFRLLTTKPYLPPDFDQETFDNAWKAWPEPLRSRAASASAQERRRLAFDRYGLTPRAEGSSEPLQYVTDAAGQWTMNCFSCHGGEVAGKVVPGLPNSRFALATLTDETRSTKLEMGKPVSRMDVGSLVVPLGGNVGVTNAAMFGVALFAKRDAELNVVPPQGLPRMVHHDLEAPPWWHYKKKRFLYIDGFAEKGHRALMQFMLTPENGPEKFREWEADFRDVNAYLESLEPPAWPFAIDQNLAAAGRTAFNRACAECHGTYAQTARENDTWPERLVPIEEIGTDRVRLDALTGEQRGLYSSSWFGHFGERKAIAEPGGYVAPPLDGVWASGPYFHHGAVPTLWHVLHPAARPTVWKRIDKAFDESRVGPKVEEGLEVPADALLDSREQRTYFDTRRFGKSNAGHDYPNRLTEDEKAAVLEYLKTL